MHLLLGTIRSVKGRIDFIEKYSRNNICLLSHTFLSLLKVEIKLMLINVPLYFSLSEPSIWFAIDSKRSLIVKALIEALENASIPKAEIGFKPWTHLFLLVFQILTLNMSLKLLE